MCRQGDRQRLCQTGTETQEQMSVLTGDGIYIPSMHPVDWHCCHYICYIGRIFCMTGSGPFAICRAYNAVLLCSSIVGSYK